MSAFILPEENEPLFYLGEFPVSLIVLLVALHSVAMIASTLLLASGYGGVLDLLTYSSTAVAHGQIWRLVTYAFVAGPSVWFLIEMVMLYYFGREVENGLGWPRFAFLYGGLILLGPLLLQAVSYAGGTQTFEGGKEVNFAIFAAFVAIHPGARFFFGMAARWVFVGLLAISSLQLLAGHQEARVLVLLATSLLAILLMRRAGFDDPLFGWSFRWALPGFRRPEQRFTVMSGGLSSASLAKKKVFDPDLEMDRLLEKISSKGIASLSDDERTTLEQARQAILQRQGGASR